MIVTGEYHDLYKSSISLTETWTQIDKVWTEEHRCQPESLKWNLEMWMHFSLSMGSFISEERTFWPMTKEYKRLTVCISCLLVPLSPSCPEHSWLTGSILLWLKFGSPFRTMMNLDTSSGALSLFLDQLDTSLLSSFWNGFPEIRSQLQRQRLPALDFLPHYIPRKRTGANQGLEWKGDHSVCALLTGLLLADRTPA